jgi:hypothetical protein
MKKIKNRLDNQQFSEIIQALIKFRSENTTIKIGDVSWEELIWATLVFMFGKDDVGWKSASHEKSVDIRVKIGGKPLKISAKGGKIDNGMLILSSYRLTTFNNLNEKLKFIRNQHSNFNFYFICAKEIKDENIIYHIIKVPSKRLAPSWLTKTDNWTKTKNAYELKKGFGFSAKIVYKMSNQLWYSIPINYFLPEERLTTVSILFSDLGKGLMSFLEKKFN